MNPLPTTDTEHAEPLFNVTVQLRPDATLESVEKRALECKVMPTEKLATLMRALRSGPVAMIGKEVTRARVDKAKNDFEQIGLIVGVTPVLAIQKADGSSWDKGFKCPACDQYVSLPENRQCPACRVFVDKVTKEFLLRKKIMEQERGKMELLAAKQAADIANDNTRSMEDAIRRQIRDELEEEYGIKSGRGLFSGRVGLLRAFGLLVLVSGAFAGGNYANNLHNPSTGAQTTTTKAGEGTPQDVDKLLASSGAKSAGASSDPGAAGDAAGPSPDVADSLVASADQGRAGGKTLTVEQAVAAANLLSGSIGGPTTQSIGATGTNAVSASAASDQQATNAAIPGLTKIALTADFAVQLAEMGQVARANEVMKTLLATPGLGADPDATAVAAIANLQVRTWMVSGKNDGHTRDQLESLRAIAGKIDDPAQRAIALARSSLILGRNPQLPKQVSTAFLTMASEAAKAATIPAQRNLATQEVVLAMAENALTEVTDSARRGMGQQAQTANSFLDAVVRQGASGALAAPLLAIDHQAKNVLGMVTQADVSLTSAVSALEREPDLSLRAALLLRIAKRPGFSRDEKLEVAATRLASAADAKGNTEKAETLARLAQFYAQSGKTDQYQALARRATEVTGLTALEKGKVGADVLVRGEMAAALGFHRAGAYQESESRIKKLASYLL